MQRNVLDKETLTAGEVMQTAKLKVHDPVAETISQFIALCSHE